MRRRLVCTFKIMTQKKKEKKKRQPLREVLVERKPGLGVKWDEHHAHVAGV